MSGTKSHYPNPLPWLIVVSPATVPDRESFDLGQDREPAERLVEPLDDPY